MSYIFGGRFQPFHLGHVASIKKILKKIKRLYWLEIPVAVVPISHQNPFPINMRIQMIRNVFPPLTVYPALDTTDPKKAEIYLTQHEIDGVYSGNPWILDVFSRYGIPTYKVERSNNISGYEIRQLIYANDDEWHQYVPSVNIKLIEKWRTSHFNH